MSINAWIESRVACITSADESSTPLAWAVAEILSLIFFSVSAHWPSRAATRSPFGRTGQLGVFQEAPRALLTTSDVSSFRLWKKARHSASKAAGSDSYLA